MLTCRDKKLRRSAHATFAYSALLCRPPPPSSCRAARASSGCGAAAPARRGGAAREVGGLDDDDVAVGVHSRRAAPSRARGSGRRCRRSPSPSTRRQTGLLLRAAAMWSVVSGLVTRPSMNATIRLCHSFITPTSPPRPPPPRAPSASPPPPSRRRRKLLVAAVSAAAALEIVVEGARGEDDGRRAVLPRVDDVGDEIVHPPRRVERAPSPCGEAGGGAAGERPVQLWSSYERWIAVAPPWIGMLGEYSGRRRPTRARRASATAPPSRRRAPQMLRRVLGPHHAR